MTTERRKVELIYEVPTGDETRRKISEIAASSDRVAKSLDAMERKYDGVARANAVFNREQEKLNGLLATGNADAAKAAKVLDDMTAARNRAIVAAQKLAAVPADPQADFNAAVAAATALEHKYDGVARATALFAEEQRQLDQMLQAGVIIEAQHTKILNDATAARDRSIAAAQKQAAAQRVDPQAELKAAVAAADALEQKYDGVARATAVFAEEQRQLDQWLLTLAIDQARYNKLLNDATVARDRSIASAQKLAGIAPPVDPSVALKAAGEAATALAHKYDGAARAAAIFIEEEKQLQEFLRAGVIDQAQYNKTLNDATVARDRAIAAAHRLAGSQNELNDSTRRNSSTANDNYEAWQRKLILQSAAVNTFQSLVAGQNILTVAMVQGSQAAGVFASQLARFALIAGPILAVVAAVGLVAYAAARQQAELRGYEVRLAAMGNQAQTTALQLRDLQKQLMAGGADRPDAISATLNLASSRQLAGNVLPQVGKLGQDYSAAFGKGLVEGTKELQSALEDGLPGIMKLDEQIGFLTKTEREAMRTMAEHGDKAGVLNTALGALDRQIGGLAQKSLSDADKAFNNISAAWDDFLDAVSRSGPVISTLTWIGDKLSGIASLIRGPQTQADLQPKIQELTAKWELAKKRADDAAIAGNGELAKSYQEAADVILDKLGQMKDAQQQLPAAPAAPPPNTAPNSAPGDSYIEQETRNQQKLAGALSEVTRQREIAMARTQAEAEAAARNLDQLQTQALIRTRIAAVIEQQGAAYRTQIEQTDALIQANQALSAAYQAGDIEAERQIALNEALALSLQNVTVNVAAEQQRILLRNAALAGADMEKILAGLDRQVKGLEAVTKASEKGAFEQAEAARQNEVAATTFDLLTKAYATGSPQIIAAAQAQAEAYDRLSERAAKAALVTNYNTRIRGQKEHLAGLQLEFQLLGATNEQRAIALAREKALNDLKIYGTKLTEEQRQAYIDNEVAIAANIEKLDEIAEISHEITDTLIKGFWDALDGVDEFGDYAIKMLKKVAEEAYIRPVLEPMVNQAVGSVLGAPGQGGISGMVNQFGGNLGFATGSAQAAPSADFVGPMPLQPGAQAGTTFGSTTLSEGLGAVGMGFGAGTMANSVVGGKQTGGAIGSATGAMAGAIIGSMIPVVGTMLGGIIGGAAGGLLGGMFGKDPKKDKKAQQRTADMDNMSKAMTEFNKLGVEAETSTGKAMSDLTAAFFKLKAEAVKLGQSTDQLEASFKRAREQIAKDFNEGIAGQIADLTGDASLGYEQLRKAQKTQMSEAVDAEGDLEQVRKLHALQIEKYFRSLTAEQLAAMGALSSAVDQLMLKIASLTQELNDALTRQMNLVRRGAQEAAEAAKFYDQVAQTIRETIVSIRQGNLSILTPLQKLNEARAQFDQMFALALSGDKSAQAKLGTLGQTLLQFSRDYNASSDWYTADFNRVTTALNQIGVTADAASVAYQRITDLLGLEAFLLQHIQEELAKPDPNTGLISAQLQSLGIIDQALQGSNNLSLAQLQTMVATTTGDLSIIDALFATNGDLGSVFLNGTYSLQNALLTGNNSLIMAMIGGNNSLIGAIIGGNGTLAGLLQQLIGKQNEQKAAAAAEAARTAKLDAYAASARQSANTYAYQIGGVRSVSAAEKMSANDQVFNLSTGAKSYEGGKSSGSQADRSNAMRAIMTGLVSSLLKITGGGGPGDATISMKDKYGSGYRIGSINKMDAFGINDTQGLITNFLSDYIRQMWGVEATLLDFMRQVSFANIPAAFEQIARKAAELRGYASGIGSAHPGFAVVGEGGPELMRFRGGERIWSADQTRKMMTNDNSDVVSALAATANQQGQVGQDTVAAIEHLHADLARFRKDERVLSVREMVANDNSEIVSALEQILDCLKDQRGPKPLAAAKSVVRKPEATARADADLPRAKGSERVLSTTQIRQTMVKGNSEVVSAIEDLQVELMRFKNSERILSTTQIRQATANGSDVVSTLETAAGQQDRTGEDMVAAIEALQVVMKGVTAPVTEPNPLISPSVTLPPGAFAAHPGLAVVGENGPERMRFRGGESAAPRQLVMPNDNSDVVSALEATADQHVRIGNDTVGAIDTLRAEQATMRRELRDLNINLQRIAKRA